MPTYILLAKFTDQGIRGIREGPKRRAAALERIARLGKELSVYYTLGRYDLVMTLDFPDEAAARAFLLEIGAQGHLRTETLQALSAEEMAPAWGKMAPR